MKILAILQARVSSSRFPGKVLKNLLGKPMLMRQIERSLRSVKISSLIVATSTHSSDDKIAELCRGNKVSCFRGSLDNVLDRFYNAAKSQAPDHIVRLTGDCPLVDPFVIDSVIEQHLVQGNDYTSNTMPPTFPDGLDVEVVSWYALKRAWESAGLLSEREHVTPFIRKHPDLFCLGNLSRLGGDLSHLRWTVDESEDFLLVQKIYEHLYPVNQAFTTDDILNLMKECPELEEINSAFKRNEGYVRSIEADGELSAPSCS